MPSTAVTTTTKIKLTQEPKSIKTTLGLATTSTIGATESVKGTNMHWVIERTTIIYTSFKIIIRTVTVWTGTQS